jgi:hypothetical protein
MILEYLRMLRLNRKGIEGLPLKYTIIILVAAIVIGIVLYMTGTLDSGVRTTTNQINQTLVNKVNSTLAGI